MDRRRSARGARFASLRASLRATRGHVSPVARVRAMRVLVVGAAGMLGRKLAKRLVEDGALGSETVSRLTLVDIAKAEPPPPPKPSRSINWSPTLLPTESPPTWCRAVPT